MANKVRSALEWNHLNVTGKCTDLVLGRHVAKVQA